MSQLVDQFGQPFISEVAPTKRVKLSPEEKRLHKNKRLRDWRANNKEHVSTYMKNWYIANGKKLEAEQAELEQAALGQDEV